MRTYEIPTFWALCKLYQPQDIYILMCIYQSTANIYFAYKRSRTVRNISKICTIFVQIMPISVVLGFHFFVKKVNFARYLRPLIWCVACWLLSMFNIKLFGYSNCLSTNTICRGQDRMELSYRVVSAVICSRISWDTFQRCFIHTGIIKNVQQNLNKVKSLPIITKRQARSLWRHAM